MNCDEVEKAQYYREALQNQLLGLCDKNGSIRIGREPYHKDRIYSSDMLFFLTGVFEDVDKNRSARVGFNTFRANSAEAPLSKNDFAGAGLSYELLGRITMILSLSNPTVEEVMEFLSGKNSPLVRYDSLLNEEGSSLIVTEEGKMAIARKVVTGNMGYRMVDNILYDLYRKHQLSCSLGDSKTSPLLIDQASVDAA